MQLLPKRYEAKLKQRLLSESKLRARWTKMGALASRMATKLEKCSRGFVRFMNHHLTDIESDWFTYRKEELHKKISMVLKRQSQDYRDYAYFYGHPYQSLGILGIYGERSTEERFEQYGLKEFLKPEDRILDIGCNCGFMTLYASFRTGCSAHGIDINPYAVEIGNLVTDYLSISDRVKLEAVRIQDFHPETLYSVVFSFATHWTDDENYRVTIRQHFETLASYLEPQGLLVFETHAADVGCAEFYKSIEEVGDLFSLEKKIDTDAGLRHLYIFRALS